MSNVEKVRSLYEETGHFYQKKGERNENYGKVKPVIKERIEDLFISVNGSPHDFAFRGIVPKDED